MRKIKRKNKVNLIFMISAYIFVLISISIAYSFFSTSLNIEGKVSFGDTVSSDYKYEYNFESSWPSENMFVYTIDSTLTYTGTDNVVGWTINIWVPSNTEVIGCYSASSCVASHNTLRITNASYNGNLNINNNSVVVRTQIKVETSNYQVKLLSVNFIKDGSVIEPLPYESETIKNISTTIKLISDWDTKKYYTIDITNNSTTNLTNFELKITLPSDATISSLWGAEYIYADNILTLTGPAYESSLPIGTNIIVNIMYDSITLKENKMEIVSFYGITSEGKKVKIEI